MDFSSVEAKLKGNKYKSPFQFFRDIDLIWFNAMTFNPPETEVYIMCKEMEAFYLQLKQNDFGDQFENE